MYKELAAELRDYDGPVIYEDADGQHVERTAVDLTRRAADAIERLREIADNEAEKVSKYAEVARAIALWLESFCDRDLTYPDMISGAARTAAKEIDKLQSELERNRGCEYCYTDANCNPFVGGYNYCPMCGRKLEGADNETD